MKAEKGKTLICLKYENITVQKVYKNWLNMPCSSTRQKEEKKCKMSSCSN